MKRQSLIWLSLFLGSCACGFAWAWRQRFSNPVIAVPDVVDLGVQRLGEYLSVPVVVRNDGAAPLELTRFRTSCGCLTVKVTRDDKLVPLGEATIAPGEQITLWSGLVTRGNAGAKLREEIRFQTTDPARPEVVVELCTEVEGAISVVPSRLELGDVRPEEIVNKRLLLRNDGRKKPFRLAGVRSSDPAHVTVLQSRLSARTEGTPLAGPPDPVSSYTVDLRISAPSGLGVFQAQIDIFDEGNPTPLFSVPVSGRVVPRFQFGPAAVVLPRQSASGPLHSAKSLCTSSTGEPFELSALPCPGGLKTTIQKLAASSYLVQVELSPGTPPQAGRKTVPFQVVSARGEEVLSLPVHLATPK